MKQIDRKISLTACLLAVMLLVYFGFMIGINLSSPPAFYDSDMYTDIRYAMEAWEHQSVFPEGWVFGNQLYAVSTPVLAALFYGLTGSPQLAMGLASTVMAVLVLLSFDWMLRPVIQSWEARLAGIVLLLAEMLYFGDAWHTTSGWQLLFTMCSYYACYAITVFLAFGCWLRSGDLKSRSVTIMLALTCVLSFGTGIQSLRQTAVMTLPLIAAEFLRVIQNVIQKKPLNKNALIITGLIAVANVAGLVAARSMDLAQVEITGEMNLIPFSELMQSLRLSILLALSLVMNQDMVSFLVLGGIVLISGAAVLGIVSLAVRKKESAAISLTGVLIISILAILAVDTFTTMLVRPIYYFMVFPLIAFLGAWVYFKGRRGGKVIVTTFLVILFALSCMWELTDVYAQLRDKEEDPAYEISEYLMENGYTTVYGAWNQGADIVVASDWNLSAGFWEYEEDPFFYYKYLCNPNIFKKDSKECVYLFYGQENAQLGIEKARTKNIEMTFLQYFPECDVYLYTASRNVMEAFW